MNNSFSVFINADGQYSLRVRHGAGGFRYYPTNHARALKIGARLYRLGARFTPEFAMFGWQAVLR